MNEPTSPTPTQLPQSHESLPPRSISPSSSSHRRHNSVTSLTALPEPTFPSPKPPLPTPTEHRRRHRSNFHSSCTETDDSDSSPKRRSRPSHSLEERASHGLSRTRWSSDLSSASKRSYRMKARLRLSIEPLFSFEIAEIAPRPLDDSRLRALICDEWVSAGDFGRPGSLLAGFFREIEDDDGLDFEGLRQRTIELLSDVRTGIESGRPLFAFRYFLSLHRFYTELGVDTPVVYENCMKKFLTFVSSTFQWLIDYLRDCVFPQFLTVLLTASSQTASQSIAEFRRMLQLRIGGFVWERVLIAVDEGLANLLVIDGNFETMGSLAEAKDRLTQLCAELRLQMPFFTQSLVFVLRYQAIIEEAIPFEEVVTDLPIGFVVALVVAGKRKRLIALEISDKRILAAADSVEVDLSLIDEIRLGTDETKTEVSPTLWDESVV